VSRDDKGCATEPTWLICDSKWMLFDGYYFSEEGALAAQRSIEARLRRKVRLEAFEVGDFVPWIYEHMWLNNDPRWSKLPLLHIVKDEG